MDIVAKHIVFSGQVQGVGFRFTALNTANNYNLTGYVRNLPGGKVEMLVQGPEKTIDSCIQDIQDSFAGYIRQTDVEAVTPDPNITDFRITF
jgi:acylphosphatase